VELRSVAVLGGGPGGLYVARLLKLQHPACRVDLYEQSPPSATFGFGVGLATRTQQNLQAADPASLADIVDHSWRHDLSMAVGDRRIQLPMGNLVAIGRSTLLGILRRHALDAGVEVHYGRRMDAADLVGDPAIDLVIAADGINSATRRTADNLFGEQVSTHSGLYLWCGTDFALPSALFRAVATDVGTFVAHAYPYQADRSTFLIETDGPTWRRAGFDATTERTPAEDSDEESLRRLSAAFADDLGGRPLIGNRTRWMRFRTVTCRRWYRDNVVLLGDAVHTAHYSIGSGTKLAMEDGIALVRALAGADDLPTALTRYQADRRGPVEHLQQTAHRSMLWWDSFPDRLDLPVEQLLMSYMTRAGKVSIDRFAATAPDAARRALAAYADCPPGQVPDERRVRWVFDRPVRAGGRHWDRRLIDSRALGEPLVVDVPDAAGAEANALIKDALVQPAAQGRGTDGIVLLAPAEPAGAGAVLTLFELAERIRRETGAAVAARVNRQWTEVAAAALASGRVDLVDLVDAAG
jgi:anthraniloyl-CoA monooxygenase